jgi:fructose-1,6-bisphosphatase/sedoheptulose 1,7-bisphosphatase-like protein
MSDKKCRRIDVEGHPIDGIRFIAKGDKTACEAKRDEILQDAGPYLKKFVTRRWKHQETQLTTPTPEEKTQHQ